MCTYLPESLSFRDDLVELMARDQPGAINNCVSAFLESQQSLNYWWDIKNISMFVADTNKLCQYYDDLILDE